MSDEKIKSAIKKICGWYKKALDGGPFIFDEIDNATIESDIIKSKHETISDLILECKQLKRERDELRAIVEQRLLAGATIHAMADELLKENNRLSDELKQADYEFAKLHDGNAKAEFDGAIMIYPKNYYLDELEIKFMRVGEKFFADPTKAESNQFVWDEENKQFYFLNKNKDLFEIVFMPVKNNACRTITAC